jgi:alpha-L-rhamnosidase
MAPLRGGRCRSHHHDEIAAGVDPVSTRPLWPSLQDRTVNRGVEKTQPPFLHAALVGPDRESAAPPRLRRKFSLAADRVNVHRATLRWTAHGIADVWVNGRPASDRLLTPGWSTYESRLRYAEHDVTDIVAGATDVVIAAQLANGWFRGRLGWRGQDRIYGTELSLLIELVVEFGDGHVQVFDTEGTWRWSTGEIVSADLYDGERIDARLRDDWLWPEYDDSSWRPVAVRGPAPATLTRFVAPPVCRTGVMAPQHVWTSPRGEVVVDFGQNLVGWLRVRVQGARGDVVVIRHAEVLELGELATRPLRSAAATDTYVLSGDDDRFEPTLTFHGFRYAGITGWPASALPVIDSVEAVIIGSDIARTGHFRCSDPDLNRLHENVVWSARANFVDLPTDCPQRDERLGWTGDIAVFAPTAAYLFDVSDFLRDWLRDLAAEQTLNGGRVPHVVPDVLKYDPAYRTDDSGDNVLPATTTAIWGDAAVWVPWAIWLAYGDRTTLAEQYEAMQVHARAVQALLSPSGLWDTGFQFADWLDPDAPPHDPGAAKADPGVVSTACAYRTFDIMARAAAIVGSACEQRDYRRLAEDTRRAFRVAYVRDGIVLSDCPTVYALAVCFDLLDAPDAEAAGSRLAALVRQSGHRISTGFAGTPFILDALADTGHVDDAFALLTQRSAPSWLYPVAMGATTIWERWDSMLPDGTINLGEMTSFNHYAFGAVADFMHRRIGGIGPLAPGYERVLVAPIVGAGGLTWAEACVHTQRGRVDVRWSVEGDRPQVEITVPVGSTATVVLPWLVEPCLLGGGGHRLVGPATTHCGDTRPEPDPGVADHRAGDHPE